MYPAEIARTLGLYQQSVYFCVRRLLKDGLIEIERSEVVKGAVARYYRPTSPAFGVELPSEEKNLPLPSQIDVGSKLERFFRGFIKDEIFDGVIVVGSPEPHGPFRATARDGHYAAQLAFLLGRLSRMPPDFFVRLDVDIRTEKKEGENLILIGGPGTNLVTESVNAFLPIRFTEDNYWRGLVKGDTVLQSSERDGIIAKIRNPFREGKTILVLAGNRHIGTKSCVIALTQFHTQVLEGYEDQEEWAVLVRGYDLDGDGKIDSAEVLH